MKSQNNLLLLALFSPVRILIALSSLTKIMQ